MMKKIYRRAVPLISCSILVLFICWLILGLGYRVFCQKNIQEKQIAMTTVLKSIKVLDQYTLQNIHLEKNTRALIAQSLTAYFVTEKDKNIVLIEIKEYLLNNSWKIESHRDTNLIISLESKKDDYICTIETLKDDTAHAWHIIIEYDDFLPDLIYKSKSMSNSIIS